MKEKSALEMTLANRMAGEVYPELLRLMLSDGISNVIIHSADIHDAMYEKVKKRFVISSKGVLTDSNALFDENLLYAGESDEVADEPINTIYNINNITVCPIFESCKDICYKYYCEQILIAIDMFLVREKRLHNILRRIDNIPQTRKVIIEKQ